jgi:hypothetical protein
MRVRGEKRLTMGDIADSVVGRDYTLRNPHNSVMKAEGRAGTVRSTQRSSNTL